MIEEKVFFNVKIVEIRPSSLNSHESIVALIRHNWEKREDFEKSRAPNFSIQVPWVHNGSSFSVGHNFQANRVAITLVIVCVVTVTLIS